MLPLMLELPADKLAKIASSGGGPPKAKSDMSISQHKVKEGAVRAGSKSSENTHASKSPELPVLARVVDQLQKDAASLKESSNVNHQNWEQKELMPHSPENAASPRGSASEAVLEKGAKCHLHSVSVEGVHVSTIPAGRSSQDAFSSVPLHYTQSSPGEVQLKKDRSLQSNHTVDKTNMKAGSSEPVSHCLQQGTTDFYLSYSNPEEVAELAVREVESESGYLGPSTAAQEPKGSAKVHESSANGTAASLSNVIAIQQMEVSKISGAEQVSKGANRGTTNFYVSYSNPVEVEAGSGSVTGAVPVDEEGAVTELDALKEEPGLPVEWCGETSGRQSAPDPDSGGTGNQARSSSSVAGQHKDNN